jgi:hypothetical protein
VYLNVAAAYRIGPGPSSSQTVGPLEAARRFTHELAADGLVARTARVRVELANPLLGLTVRDGALDWLRADEMAPLLMLPIGLALRKAA